MSKKKKDIKKKSLSRFFMYLLVKQKLLNKYKHFFFNPFQFLRSGPTGFLIQPLSLVTIDQILYKYRVYIYIYIKTTFEIDVNIVSRENFIIYLPIIIYYYKHILYINKGVGYVVQKYFLLCGRQAKKEGILRESQLLKCELFRFLVYLLVQTI